MSIRVFILILFLFYGLFFLTEPAFAQFGGINPTPVPNIQQRDPIKDTKDFIDAILSFIKQPFDSYINASVPPGTKQVDETNSSEESVKGIFDNPEESTLQNYALAAAVRGPFEAKGTQDWLDAIKEKFGLKPAAKEYGQNVVNMYFPIGANTNCEQETCFSKVRCVGLPSGSCKDNIAQFEGQPTPPPGYSQSTSTNTSN
ncbi:hypothetical protein HYW54_05070 [Candidatus Gottesmanbacteria bacterium]|nr:hypothetical protein [Candidatus Gottesmanbacteria bacterium]